MVTPGPMRLVIELIITAVAVAGAWVAWPVWAGVVLTVVAGAAMITGAPRTRWLAAGAPLGE